MVARIAAPWRSTLARDAARLTLESNLPRHRFRQLLLVCSRVALEWPWQCQLPCGCARNDSKALLETLDGTLDFEVLKGALEGADLWYEIRRAQACSRAGRGLPKAAPAPPSFRALKAQPRSRPVCSTIATSPSTWIISRFAGAALSIWLTKRLIIV